MISENSNAPCIVKFVKIADKDSDIHTNTQYLVGLLVGYIAASTVYTAQLMLHST